jgi:Pyruvate/2-oxoacid:ferredoxin oxidoreductase delta subunit
VARGQAPKLGPNIVVVGGGNTAIDVARTCARLAGGQANIALLRRRNPSLGGELQEAADEGIRVELRGTISKVVRDASGKLARVVAEYLSLEAKDAQGNPTLMPVPGSAFDLPADAIIVALGQKPNMGVLVQGDPRCLEAGENGKTHLHGVWRGGDAVTPTLAAVVINQGRIVALSVDAELRGRRFALPAKLPELSPKRLKLDWYEARARLGRKLAAVPERVGDLSCEVELGHGRAEILAEAERCLSCGSCFGCENCWMYCTPNCMQRLPDAAPGRYFDIKMATCDGCNKCAEQCPCGSLDMV